MLVVDWKGWEAAAVAASPPSSSPRSSYSWRPKGVGSAEIVIGRETEAPVGPPPPVDGAVQFAAMRAGQDVDRDPHFDLVIRRQVFFHFAADFSRRNFFAGDFGRFVDRAAEWLGAGDVDRFESGRQGVDHRDRGEGAVDDGVAEVLGGDDELAVGGNDGFFAGGDLGDDHSRSFPTQSDGFFGPRTDERDFKFGRGCFDDFDAAGSIGRNLFQAFTDFGRRRVEGKPDEGCTHFRDRGYFIVSDGDRFFEEIGFGGFHLEFVDGVDTGRATPATAAGMEVGRAGA
jgi:hypothetical protein